MKYYRTRAHAKGVVFSKRRASAFKCLLESPFLEPLLRTLLRTLPPPKAQCKTPSENPWAGLLPDLRADHWYPGFGADFFGALFGLKHRKISRKPPRGPFFFCAKVGLRETLVIVPSETRLRTLSKAISRTLLGTLLRRRVCRTTPLVCTLRTGEETPEGQIDPFSRGQGGRPHDRRQKLTNKIHYVERS